MDLLEDAAHLRGRSTPDPRQTTLDLAPHRRLDADNSVRRPIRGPLLLFREGEHL